jgi:hypothetical protein
LTVTVTDCGVLPPLPVQLRLKVTVAVSALMASLPEVDFVPVHPSDAEQLLALEDDQVRVVEPLASTVVGLAESATVGAGGGGGGGGVVVTVTVAFACALPPGPEQLRPKLVVAMSGPTIWLPEVTLLPLQPPDAVQDVALVLDQVSVLELLVIIVDGEALSATVGTDGAATLTTTVRLLLPSVELVQVSVKELVACSGPTVSEPDMALVPAQASDAEQPEAFVVDQVNVAEPPGCTEVGLADSVMPIDGELSVRGTSAQIGSSR